MAGSYRDDADLYGLACPLQALIGRGAVPSGKLSGNGAAMTLYLI